MRRNSLVPPAHRLGRYEARPGGTRFGGAGLGRLDHDKSRGHRFVIPFDVGVDPKGHGDGVIVEEPPDPRPAGAEPDLQGQVRVNDDGVSSP